MNKPEATIEYMGKTWKFVGLSSPRLIPRNGDVVRFQTPIDTTPDAPRAVPSHGISWNAFGVDHGHYQVFYEVKPRRSHRNTPRKTARERAVYVINRGAMAEDIEKQIQLAVKAYAKRKARR